MSVENIKLMSTEKSSDFRSSIAFFLEDVHDHGDVDELCQLELINFVLQNLDNPVALGTDNAIIFQSKDGWIHTMSSDTEALISFRLIQCNKIEELFNRHLEWSNNLIKNNPGKELDFELMFCELSSGKIKKDITDSWKEQVLLRSGGTEPKGFDIFSTSDIEMIDSVPDYIPKLDQNKCFDDLYLKIIGKKPH